MRREYALSLAALALFALLPVGACAAARPRPGVRPQAVPSPPEVPAEAQAPFDAGAVVDQIRHALRPVPGVENHWVVEGLGYRAEFDETGLEYTVLRPQRGERQYEPVGLAVEEAGRVRMEVSEVGEQPLLSYGSPDAVPGPIVHGNEIVYFLPSGVQEIFRARPGGLEREVVIPQEAADAARLAGYWADGDIPVRTRLRTDLTVRPADKGGVEFVGEGYGAAVMRYRSSGLRDAAGRRLEAAPVVSPRFGLDGYEISTPIPAQWLRQATYPVAADLIIGDEIPISTDATPTWAYNWQARPAVASDGTNYLLVWQDGRNGTTSLATGGYDVYGARVSPEGVILDQCGIPISTARYNQVEPDVAFDGTNYLVVWMDARSSTGQTDYWEIWGTRVDPTGVVQDPAGILIDSSSGNFDELAFPAVAYGAGNYLVVYQTFLQAQGGPELRGKRLAPSGEVVDSDPILVMLSPFHERDYMFPDCDFDGVNWLVVANSSEAFVEGKIVGARVDRFGTVLDTPETVIADTATPQLRPAVAFGDGDYLVAWRIDAMLYASLVTRDAVVSGGPFHVGRGYYDWDVIGMAFDGTRWLVASGDYTLAATWVYGDGTIGEALQIAPDPTYRVASPAVAVAGDVLLVTWDIGSEVFAARVGGDGTVLDPGGFCVSWAPANQEYPDVAFDGTNYMVVWSDARDGSALLGSCSVYGARVSSLGEVLDPGGFRISTGPALNELGHPAIAFDGTCYLVAWAGIVDDWSRQEVCAVRVTPEGEVLGPQLSSFPSCPMHPLGEHFAPDVAFGGGVYLVTYEHQWSMQTPAGWDVLAVRVSTNGQLLDDVPIVVRCNEGAMKPAVAFDGTSFVIVWMEYGWSQSFSVMSARVSPTGELLDASPLEFGGLEGASESDQLFPKIASSGDGALVVWYEVCSGSHLYGARLSQSHQVLDPGGFPICTAPGDQWAPNVTWDGTKYLVVWDDGRSHVDCDVYGSRVLTSGQVVDADGIALSTASGHQSFPAIAASGPTSLSAWDDDRSYPASGRNILGTLVNNAALSPLLAWAGPDKAIRQGGFETLEGQAFGGMPPYHYEWSPSETLDNPFAQHPVASPGTATHYTLTVTDADEQHASDGVSIWVARPLPFYDDFSADRGWTGYGRNMWERGPTQPNGYLPEISDPAYDHSSSSDNCVLGYNIGGYYQDDIVSARAITSPPLDCSGVSSVWLGFWRDLKIWSPSDHASVLVSRDGVTWTQIWDYSGWVSDADWTYCEYDISSLAAGQSMVYVQFAMGPTDYEYWAGGWSIDDLAVSALAVEALVASAGPDRTVASGSSTVLVGSASGGVEPYIYSWSPATGLSDPNIAQPTASPTSTTSYTLTVTDSFAQTDADTATVTVASGVVAEAGPDKTIASGGSATLEGSASGGIAPHSYAWSPATGLSNPNVARPTALPTSTTTYTLTVTDDLGQTDTDTVTVTVASAVVAEAGPDRTLASGGLTTLEGSASGGVPPYTYSWAPTAGLSDPDIAQPVASPASTTAYTLTVTDHLGQTATDATTVTVASGVVADAGPNRVIAPGGSITLAGSASGGLPPYTYSWSPTANLSNPTIAQPVASPTGTTTYTLTVTDSLAQTNADTVTVAVLSFSDVSDDFWANSAIMACVSAGIVSGYEDGTYHPEWPVTRDQMAVYVSRALAGGDSNVPDFTDTPTFSDVGETHWALKYIEYAVDQAVVTGYDDGTYHPEYQVDRGQMAVYVARALVAPEGEAGLSGYVPADPRNFSDVPSDFWAYKHVEYCVENGVVNGYDDGLYHPEYIVTRDQMAVYVARAFGLL